MVSDEYVTLWSKIEGTAEEEKWFPEYFVSQPPHRDTLTPIYYKVVSPSGPVFWRRKSDDTGQETSLYDMLMEEKKGHGIQSIEKKYTPWSD